MSDPIEILERRLKRTLARTQDSLGLHFFCQIGGNYDELGIITLQISGVGRVLLSCRQGDEDSLLWSVLLPESDLRRFQTVLLEHPFWRANPMRRPRRGDEINVHLRLVDQTKGTYNGLQFWTDDMEEFPVLRAFMSRMTRLIRALSEGEITSIDLDKFS